MDVILRSTEVYHSPATSSWLIKHLSMSLHCLHIDVLLPSFIKTSRSLLFSMASFSWLKCCEGATICPWDAPSWCLLWSQPILFLKCSFTHKLLVHVSKEFCLLPSHAWCWGCHILSTQNMSGSHLLWCCAQWDGQGGSFSIHFSQVSWSWTMWKFLAADF